MININKHSIRIIPSSNRTLVRPFVPGSESQVENILSRIFSTPRIDRKRIVENLHKRLEMPDDMSKRIFLRHFENMKPRIPWDIELSDIDKQFIGAYFTQQYALESTALFNPSIVPHPDQDKEGVTRFIFSLRAIGEGHISSITFREGQIDKDFKITVKDNSPAIYEPERKEHIYNKETIIKKANDLKLLSNSNEPLFNLLSDEFSFDELNDAASQMIMNNIHH